MGSSQGSSFGTLLKPSFTFANHFSKQYIQTAPRNELPCKTFSNSLISSSSLKMSINRPVPSEWHCSQSHNHSVYPYNCQYVHYSLHDKDRKHTRLHFYCTTYITFNSTNIHITVCGILIARNRIHRFYCWLCLQITVWCHYDIKKKTRLSLSLYLLYDVMKVHYCNMNHYSKCTVQCTLFVYIPVLSTNVWMIVNMVHKSDPYFIRSVSIYAGQIYCIFMKCISDLF